MNSTTLKIEVAGNVFHLACRRRERFCIGSAPDCKLSLDGEGVAEEHCEIERSGGNRFAVLPLDGNEVAVNGQLSDGSDVETPFDLRIARFTLRFELVQEETLESSGESPDEKDEAKRRHAVRFRPSEAVIRPQVILVPTCPDVQPPRMMEEEIVASISRRTTTRAAIPALRFGGRRRTLEGRPRLRLASSPAGNANLRIPMLRNDEAFLSADTSSAGSLGQRTIAIPLPLRGRNGNLPLKETRSPASRAVPVTPRKVSAGLIVAMFVVLALLFTGGAGWFAWRKFVLPQRPEMLAEKAGQGDLTALATLGLSHLRGEWGAEFDFPKGRSLIEQAAEEGDPCGLLGIGLLCHEGFAVGSASGNLHDAAFAYWQRALDSGAMDVAVERNDPRWIALAVFAEWQVKGAVSEESSRHLDQAIEAGYPTASIVRLTMEEDSSKRELLLVQADERARQALRRGSVYAESLLGWLHTSYEFSGVDPRFGRDRLRRAAEAGEPSAALRLAALLGKDGEESDAYLFAARAEDAGLVAGKALVGRFRFDGVGTARDQRGGFILAKEAADAGAIDGLAVMARAFAKGEGIEADPAQAERLWLRLIEHGRVEFNADFGEHLADQGREDEAVDPLRAAALDGDMAAAMRLGSILANVSPNDDALYEEAVSWLGKALEAGQANAAVTLARIVDDPRRERRDPARAVDLLRRLAEEGDQKSGVRLAHYYREGRGVERDPTKALLLLKEAADAGESSAFFPLAELYETGTESLLASPASALLYFQKALTAGDDSVSDRFPALISGRDAVTAFVESWADNDQRRTLAWIGEEVSDYFHLARPDAPSIAALEEGFRTLWPVRTVAVGDVETVSLLAFDRIEFQVSYRTEFSRDSWDGAVRAVATVEMVFSEDGGAPRVVRFSEKVEEWLLEPSPDRFERSGEKATTRNILPAISVAESTFDYANVPLKHVDSVKAMPFADKFGGNHAMLPVSLGEGVISFARLSGRGEVLVPETYFETNTLERIQRMADGQSFADFEKWRAGLILAPDRTDPATAALLRSAESGDHEAEALVGEAYYDGLGTFPKNRVEAFNWFIRARRANHILAYTWIEIMTQTNEISSDALGHDKYADLVRQMKRAAETEARPAPYRRAIAEFHRRAYGDSSESRNFLEQASNLGDTRAKHLLGLHYLESSPTIAAAYLRTAADNRCASAATELAKYYLNAGKDARFVPDLLRSSAIKGDEEAQRLFGEFLARGGMGDGKEVEAAFWLELALRNAISNNNDKEEVAVRETIRVLADRIEDNLYRRVSSFFDRNSSTVVRLP
jgi:TPR repeat protein